MLRKLIEFVFFVTFSKLFGYLIFGFASTDVVFCFCLVWWEGANTIVLLELLLGPTVEYANDFL
jgi:hypothetical protein